jgi:cell division protein FtsZ
MDMAMGEQACFESTSQLLDAMREADIVVVLAGLGGGTGSGAAPVVAEMARRRGSMAISLSTLPFSVEGSNRKANASVGQANLALRSDVSMVMPNDHLLESSPSLSLLEAFRTADEALLEPVILLRRLLTTDDMPVLNRVFKGAGAGHLGGGEATGKQGYGVALDQALDRMYPEIPPRACDRALVMFSAGSDGPRDEELFEIVRSLHLSMAPEAVTLWGVSRDPDMGGTLRSVVVLASGPKR